MRRLLMVTDVFPYASPGRAVRLAKRARLLETRGWHCTILTTPALEESADQRFLRYAPESTEFVTVRDMFENLRRRHYRQLWATQSSQPTERTPGFGFTDMTRLVRQVFRWGLLDYWSVYIPWLALSTSRLLSSGNFSAVVSTSSPFSAHIATYLATRKNHTPWVAEFRDPWANHASLSNKKVRSAIARTIEKVLLRGTSAIVLYEGWFPTGVSHFRRLSDAVGGRAHALPRPGFDPVDYPKDGARPPQDVLTITHYGNFYSTKCDVRPFFQGLVELHARTPDADGRLRVRLLGTIDEDVRRIIHETGADSLVDVVGEVPHAAGVRYLRASGVGLWIGSDGYVENVPGKVFDYVGAQIPVLAICPEGPGAEFIRENALGHVVTGNEPAAIADALSKLLREFDQGECIQVSQETASKFSMVETERRFADILDLVSGQRRSVG